MGSGKPEGEPNHGARKKSDMTEPNEPSKLTHVPLNCVFPFQLTDRS